MKILIEALLLACVILLENPGTASAYLDPSAGNALIYIAVTLVSVSAYSLKSLYYFMTGKSHKHSHDSKNDIALFTEGKIYWTTFEPVINALFSRNQSFSYYTMDIEDPGLRIRNKLMTSRYIGTGSAAYARLNRVECKIMLATTPNIGTPSYNFPRPAKTENLVHVFHDPGDSALYKKGALDFYDTVITAGDYAQPNIRFIEDLRHLKHKELISLGVPCWDKMYQERKNFIASLASNSESGNSRKVILIAPSWGEKGIMSCYSLDFIRELANEFDIIFRPHPQSRKSEPELLERARRLIDSLPCKTEWDETPSPAESLAKADLLISDSSSIRLDCAVIYEKPVISLEVKAENISSFEISDMPEGTVPFADRICRPIKASEINNIVSIVKEALKSENVKSITQTARTSIVNLGTAGEHIAEYLVNKITNPANSKEAVNNAV